MLVCFSFSSMVKADEMILKGAFYGYNLYLVNPSVADSFCVYEIYVNDTLTEDVLNSNGIEIDLAYLKLEYGTEVVIRIVHCDDCVPIVVNPEDLLPPDNFKFSSIKTKDESLVFRIRGKPGINPYEIEQFRWNKWIPLDEIDVTDTVQSNVYVYNFKPHSGFNTFRVKKIDKYGETVYSKETRYRDGRIRPIEIVDTKVDLELEFTDETDYQIFDLEGNLIQEGRKRYVDVTQLPKGKYWVNYDNATEEIKKK